MSGQSRTSADLDPRRRKVLFRSWHRGMREMDLIMGRFAESRIDSMTDAELTVFEALIEVPDRDLFAWIADREEVPDNYNSTIYRELKAFHTHDKPIHA